MFQKLVKLIDFCMVLFFQVSSPAEQAQDQVSFEDFAVACFNAPYWWQVIPQKDLQQGLEQESWLCLFAM